MLSKLTSHHCRRAAIRVSSILYISLRFRHVIGQPSGDRFPNAAISARSVSFKTARNRGKSDSSSSAVCRARRYENSQAKPVQRCFLRYSTLGLAPGRRQRIGHARNVLSVDGSQQAFRSGRRIRCRVLHQFELPLLLHIASEDALRDCSRSATKLCEHGGQILLSRSDRHQVKLFMQEGKNSRGEKRRQRWPDANVPHT